MERITMSIDERLAQDFDRVVRDRHYASRSEAMRDLLRREVESYRQARDPRSQCVATLSYVFSHRERKLAERLAQAQHEQHDLVVSAMRVLLDHDHCLEVLALKGATAAVQGFADRVLAERGVRHGVLNRVSVETGHGHGAGGTHRHGGHLHLIPRS